MSTATEGYVISDGEEFHDCFESWIDVDGIENGIGIDGYGEGARARVELLIADANVGRALRLAAAS